VSERDVDVVRRFYEALSRVWSSPAGLDDPALDRAAAECLGPRWEFVFARPEGTGLESHYRGLEGFRDGLGVWLEDWREWQTSAEQLLDLGDRVLVLSRSRGRTSSGPEIEVETAELHELEAGRVVRSVSFPSRAEALDLLQLPPASRMASGTEEEVDR
jgi:ketosteroid isomerase-like protein